MKSLKGIALFSAALCYALGSTAASAAIITQWNFNSVPADANIGTGSTSPSTGTGTVALVGGTTATFASGDVNGGSTDPATGDDTGWGTTTYAAQGTGNKSRGIQATASTAGFFDIFVTWDERHSNTAANTTRLQYTLDATVGSPVWVDGPQFVGNAGDTWFNNRNGDLSAIAGLDNNSKAAFRVVAEFGNANAYVASNSSSSYATTGTLRYDMLTISGTQNQAPVVTPDGGTRGIRPVPGRILTQQFGFTDDQSSTLTWSVVSFTGPTVPASYGIDGTGKFTWDVTGVPGGSDQVYNLVVKGTDSFGLSNEGSISIVMPEPDSLVLAGLSILAQVCFRRR